MWRKPSTVCRRTREKVMELSPILLIAFVTLAVAAFGFTLVKLLRKPND